jgi:signal transduction histidine kinase/CheY-like chemotaxis protein
MISLGALDIRREEDLVRIRRAVRLVSAALALDPQEQVRVAAAISEIARNALQHAGGGRVEFHVRPREALAVTVTDSGPGIPDVDAVLEGRAYAGPQPGHGINTARRLMDAFSMQSASGQGVRVEMEKRIPRSAAADDPATLDRIRAELQPNSLPDPYEEIRRQNREIRELLDALRDAREANELLSVELEETNRGVVALHAELEQKAEYLRQVSELKTRFLSYMSHEFRTPVNSIIRLTQMLLDRLDGQLTSNQEMQVKYIHHSGRTLLELVNDLLDLAKAEAGKLQLQVRAFDVGSLFGALRGILRPLILESSVELVFESTESIPPLVTDESKLAQILRNFISNALKFTQRGEVRVSAHALPGDWIEIVVADTGIGIAPSDLGNIFQEFVQVQSALQARAKGSGLGLALSKKLAELLGGRIKVESTLGQGSRFSVEIPIRYPSESENESNAVLVIDNDPVDRYILTKSLEELGCRAIEAESGPEGLRLAQLWRPRLVFLDLNMPEMPGDEVLAHLKADSTTRPIPVIIYTSKVLEPEERRRLESVAKAVLSKEATARSDHLTELRRVLEESGLGKVAGATS